MRLTDATMYARVLAGDAAYNGRFFTGVLTTGIYCLPSCKARKPLRQNVRFFPPAQRRATTVYALVKNATPMISPAAPIRF